MSKENAMKRVLCFVLVCGAFLPLPMAAQAEAPVRGYEMNPSTTEAGGHPNLTTFLWVGNRVTQNIPAPSCDCQDARDVIIHAPTGVIGDPHAVPRCNSQEFGNFECAADSQVGIAEASVYLENPTLGKPSSLRGIPVYDLIPHQGQAGLLGFYVPLLQAPIYLVIDARTESDYGLNVEALSITHFLPLAAVTTELWGVPASHEHDNARKPKGCEILTKSTCEPTVESTSQEMPFLSNPTTCGVALTSSVEVRSYDGETSRAEAPYPATTACDLLSFNPSMFAQPTTKGTDSASGLDLDLQVPQVSNPTTPSPSELRSNVLTLPEGLTLAANAADGKVACTDAESRIGTREEARCPENSKVGTLTLDSSALPGPIPGNIYLGEPKPGERFRLILTANGYNVHVKLPSTITPDPATGQLTVTTDNLPQSPFTDFNMHFFGSERGTLDTPTRCGTFAVQSRFTPWDSLLADQISRQFFSIDSGPGGAPCPGSTLPFAPQLTAGVVDKSAGQHSTFMVNFSRVDGDQNLRTVDVATPPGFAATLAGIPYCPEDAIAKVSDPSRSGLQEQSEPGCPIASQVGTVVAAVGAGSHPLYTPGRVYLAGPYKGAPLSLFAVIPGVSGPYDLGNVVDRVALHVDPIDAHVSATADPFPRILEGVPLRTRSVLLQLDRPGFAINPTNCSPFRIDTTIFGEEGGRANISRHFQVANCASLDFTPTLDLRLTGGVNRLGHPAIHAVFRSKSGQANASSVSVTLPDGELLDNAHIRNICTRVAFAADSCPPGSIIGHAKAFTPLLDQPLEGLAYLRSSSNELPDIAVDLKGQIDFELTGKISSVDGRLRSSFQGVPDVPVSKFVLDLLGGAKGLLINSKGLCGAGKRATVRMAGQNGKHLNIRSALNPSCRPAGTGKLLDHRRVLRAREAK